MKIRCTRPAGGMGDVIMCMAAFKGLRYAYPEAELVFFSRVEYHAVLNRCPDLDRWYNCDDKERQPRRSPPDEVKYPSLALEPGPWFKTVDLWCPAWCHEFENTGPVTQSRIESFCREAGVWSLVDTDPRPRLNLSADDHRRASQWFENNNVTPSRCIGWQPYATDASRTWPLERVQESVYRLLKMGYNSIIFDCVRNRCKLKRVFKCAGLPLETVMAIVHRLPLVIGPDSGFVHLCGSQGIDTPHLGLFGKTSGKLWTSPYPLGMYLQGKAVDCDAPCWYRSSKGHRFDECRRRGCSALLNISVDSVVEGARQVLCGKPVKEETSGGFTGYPTTGAETDEPGDSTYQS